MSSSRDYPKFLTHAIVGAIRDHDLAEAAGLFRALPGVSAGALAPWAELLDELAQSGHAWSDWEAHWPGGEDALVGAVYFLVMGLQALAEEAFEHAGYYLMRCAEAAPDSAVPLAYLGAMYESQGCPTEAVAYYRRALTHEPGLFSVLNALGNLHHELGFYAEAVDAYQAAYPLLQEPGNQAILLGNLGNSLRALGRLDEAIAAYTEAIALDPSQPTSPIALGETLIEARREAQAIGCLTDLLMLPAFDDWPLEARRRCYGLLARAYRTEKAYPAALFYMWIENGRRIDERDGQAVSALLKALYAWALDTPGQPTYEYLLARLNRQLGYLDAALHHAKRATKQDPRVEHFIELGATLALKGKTPVALEAFEEAAALAPERAEIHSLRAIALWRDDMPAAEAALFEACRLEPNQALHHCDLAYLYGATGQDRLAQAAYQQAILIWEQAPVLHGAHGPIAERGCYADVIDPYLAENANSPAAAERLLTAASYLILSGRREQARKALHRLLAEQPGHPDALRNYAWLLTREGRYPEALSIWRKALAGSPDPVSRFFALKCLAREGAGARRMAIAELESRLAEDARDPLARLLLARLLEPEAAAIAHLETLRDMAPGCYAPWHHLATSLFHRGRADEALTAATRAARLNPQFAPTQLLLARCHDRLGDPARAMAASARHELLNRRLHRARALFSQAVMLEPGCAEAHTGLDHIERRLARLERPDPAMLYTELAARFRV